MKVKQIQNKKIIETLDKKGFIEINPICIDCICNTIRLVEGFYMKSTFHIEHLENPELYILRIIV